MVEAEVDADAPDGAGPAAEANAAAEGEGAGDGERSAAGDAAVGCCGRLHASFRSRMPRFRARSTSARRIMWSVGARRRRARGSSPRARGQEVQAATQQLRSSWTEEGWAMGLKLCGFPARFRACENQMVH